MATEAREFIATSKVPCEECGGDTMAPYTDDAGRFHDGYYCEGCGWTTRPRTFNH